MIDFFRRWLYNAIAVFQAYKIGFMIAIGEIKNSLKIPKRPTKLPNPTPIKRKSTIVNGKETLTLKELEKEFAKAKFKDHNGKIEYRMREDKLNYGVPIDLKDVCGEEICVGDILYFDEKEWGSSDHYFQIELDKGEIHMSGCPSDMSQWCYIVRNWNEED